MILILTPNDIPLKDLKSRKRWPEHIRYAADVANTVLYCETLKCRDQGRDLMTPNDQAQRPPRQATPSAKKGNEKS